jgi:hypothetical protein
MGGPTYDIPPMGKPREKRLDSWKEIAACLNRDVTKHEDDDKDEETRCIEEHGSGRGFVRAGRLPSGGGE